MTRQISGMLGVCPFEYVHRSFSPKGFRSDVEIHHLETRQPLRLGKINVLDEGPLRAAVSAELKYGKSSINVVVRSLLLLGLSSG